MTSRSSSISEVKTCHKGVFELAPLHNPPNMEGIEACEVHLPQATQVAVFDTAFHTTIPEEAYLYGLPYRFYRNIRFADMGSMGSATNMSPRGRQVLPATHRGVANHHLPLGNGSSMTRADTARAWIPAWALPLWKA